MKNRRTLIVRIVAIVLAALMVLSVGTILIHSFAAGVPATGSTEEPKWMIYALVAGLALIAVCVIVPSLKKKNK